MRKIQERERENIEHKNIHRLGSLLVCVCSFVLRQGLSSKGENEGEFCGKVRHTQLDCVLIEPPFHHCFDHAKKDSP